MLRNKRILNICIPFFLLFVLTAGGFFFLANKSHHKSIQKINLTAKALQIDIYPQLSRIRLPVILYHYVEHVKDEGDFIRKGLSLTPENFEEQLESLQINHYQTYFVKDIPKIFEGKIEYSTKSAVLTFDDGFADFYTDAFPLLKKYQTKATIYVVYNFIGHPNYMNKDQIQEVVDSGLVELGSHSLDHVNLASESAVKAKKEIFDSKEKLEKEFGISVETFAYPYGSFNKNTAELVKEAAYKAAVSVKPGVIQAAEDIFKLTRTRPGIFSGRDIVKVLQMMN